MRKTVMLVVIPIAVLGIAVAVVATKHDAGPKSTDQFAQDLQLAQTQGQTVAYSLTETAPASKPQPAKSIKQGSGPKAIRSKTPTVKAAPEPVMAQSVEPTQETQTTQTAPTPAPTEVIAQVPQTAQPEPTQGPILRGGSGRSTGSGAGDGGMGLGGILGAILRGGGVDGDNCDPRPSGRGRQPNRPVYGGNPGGMGGVRTGTPIGFPTPATVIGGVFGSRPRR